MLTEGMEGTIIVDETPFYATMGGQIGDSGVISSPKGSFTVKDTFKAVGGKIVHVGQMTSGELRVAIRLR